MQIVANDYKNLLLTVRKQIQETENLISSTVTRQKVVMAWQIGKLIDEHLSKNTQSGYGENLFLQLAQDILITTKVLYKMRGFYQTYKELPKDNESLNWSHYRSLSGVKEEEERKNLEKLVIENGWGSNQLAVAIKESREEKLGEEVKKDSTTPEQSDNLGQKSKKLSPIRGQLFTYPLVSLLESKQVYIDLGFGIFKEITTSIKPETTVVSKKEGEAENYSFKEVDVSGRKLNIYKACLERVVDGDTIRVILDLGFKTFHEEILRLKGIDAPELATDDGKKSKKALVKILQGAPFLIIKTIKIDIYGRYVADVFFAEQDLKNNSVSLENIDAQEVANNGIYLNQLLLDGGFVEMLEG